ncbi:hypothetical protein BDN72DRAFT_807283 [Pluteus cervinus]|uniref:Uncharacterized protein n=1 Tax=Pluteus cervinus TaxID=181527 RepID=A0ACD3BH71_9AGAR|nr:hypothetical protein BDN72DRAFT_807283 [Pluteus cervinus]
MQDDHSSDSRKLDTEPEDLPRKRRKGDEDADYQPPGHRRHTPRKHAAKTKHAQVRPPSPSPMAPTAPEPMDTDDARLASTDLEDCEDIWLGELSEYMLETQKRQIQVEKWFETTMLEQNALAAQRLSHHYASRIARIPLPAPIPSGPPPPLIDEYPSFSPEHGSGSDAPNYPGGSRAWEVDRRYHNSAEEAAHEVEMAMLGEATELPRHRTKTKAKDKRPAAGAASDADSELEALAGPAPKKRKVERLVAGHGDEDRFHASAPPKAKGKGKQIVREPSHDSISVTPKAPRKKGGPKKKIDLENTSHPPSIAGDITPVVSRPSSPAPTVSTLVYDLDETVPPLKKAKKVDDASMLKRIKTLEDAQRKVWTNIAKKDVARAYKFHSLGSQARQSQAERLAKLASIQARKPFTKNAKAVKDTQAKAKRLMREMQVFWKKNEKEERDVRKREQKEASDRMKAEEEKREAARQARKLEFLISQTELYSHFVGSKLKTTEIEGDAEPLPVPVGANLVDVDPSALQEINFDDEDQTNLHNHARANAQEAIALAKQRAQQFDTQAALERKTNEALKLAKAQAHIRDDAEEQQGSETTGLVDLDSDELNFQNPTSLSGSLTIGQPKMLMAQLKEYQLKGLNWLATLYEQGINGILADEMGLGKTVQSISLLAYLAEHHDIWGPFLVVAPASTLHNWQQEITRFVPRLKALPYWGNVKDRTTLRKFWSKKEISYNQDAPFHVLITSYQLVTQDQQYFQRVKWQYMILDEAQNIKNSSSVRWKTLLGFQCRNRLLLTGTPIQNSMQELWALLHFIMPSLFDSHDEFNEWFSKDIENAAENKGSKLNEHQLRRLHMILKPFMLRRVKRHVQNELSEKIEKDIFVDLSPRQRALYKGLLANVSVADLLEKAANIGDVDSARSLMNLVMQFRKVCNHPELFERADVVAPFSFTKFGRSGRETDFVPLAYSTRNPIEFSIPALFYRDGGLLSIPNENAPFTPTKRIPNLFNIWSTDWLYKSIYNDSSSSFAFLPLCGIYPQDAHALHRSPLIRRQLSAIEHESHFISSSPYSFDSDFAAHSAQSRSLLILPPKLLAPDVGYEQPNLRAISTTYWIKSCLSRPGLNWYIPSVVAPPISVNCTDRSFLEIQTRILDAPEESLALYGLTPYLRESEESCNEFRETFSGLDPAGLLQSSPQDQCPRSLMHVPEAKRLIFDSAKLARLDTLLQELKAGDHRVLVYFQMTRMMDLMEEYLIYRQYKYLRLDGSSKLEDRRDMVIDWQTRPDIFVFLLSTRAGGLGINLTAADTVVFYDHDWNPSNDAQAMDRAHRLGQTRQVTVYRLITKGTIDERIIQLARVKKDVQDIVVGNKNFTDVTKPSEIVQLLLNDEQLASLDSSAANGLATGTQSSKPGNEPVRDLWNEEGDDFFGHTGNAAPAIGPAENGEDETGTPMPTSTRGKKRKAGQTGTTRPRKTNARKRAQGVDVPSPSAS